VNLLVKIIVLANYDCYKSEG